VPLVTALYLSIALVVVAFVARDVVLRVHAQRVRAADIDEVRAEGRQGRCDLHNSISVQDAAITVLRGDHEQLVHETNALRAEVAVLKTTANLRGGR
jgi:hypothetical protein